jgi:hypothetical protein
VTPGLCCPRRFQIVYGVDQRQRFTGFVQVRAFIAGRERQIFEALRDSVAIATG